MTASPDPTQRFSDRVSDYALARPTYPDEVVKLLSKEIGLKPPAVIADIGSGTGLSAEPFLRHGYTVVGVEPNDAMRAAAESFLHGHTAFRSVTGSAEATTLAADSVDAILVAQAFHWFDLERARAEFARILRPDGWAVLLWNTRRTEGTPFLRAYEALLQHFGTDYAQVQHRTGQLASGERTAGAELDRFFRGPYERRVLPNAQALDRDSLRARIRSASYMPAEGSAAFAPMLAAVDALFDEHASRGKVTLQYDLEVYFGHLS